MIAEIDFSAISGYHEQTSRANRVLATACGTLPRLWFYGSPGGRVPTVHTSSTLDFFFRVPAVQDFSLSCE